MGTIEIVASFLTFFAMVVGWFVLPSAPSAHAAAAVDEPLATAA